MSAPHAPRWHYRRSLASRVVVLTTLAVGIAVTFVSLGAYVTARMQLRDSLDSSLLSRAKQATEATTLQRSVINDVPPFALGAGDIRIAFIDVGAVPPVISADPEGPVINLGDGRPELGVALRQNPYSIRTVSTVEGNYRVVAVPGAQPGQALVLAQSLGPQEQVLERLGVVTLIFGIAGVIAAAIAGWAVARNGLRPVRKLTRSVETIARTEDLTPITIEGDDEIARLATAFNQMLASLDLSRERQRRLVADAGHELRTPLTSLRTNLELLAQVDQAGAGGMTLDPAARRDLLDDVRAQIEELSTLVGDLVELARDEPASSSVQSVELEEIVGQALSRVRRRAATVTFEAETEPWTVEGDVAMLERAVTNLLDNAAKWSPPGGTVSVSLREGTLVVVDDGPGIAEVDLPHVFERFYRSEDSRSMPGSGLGLSIVAQAAARHSGEVRADRAPGRGARLVLSLPGASATATPTPAAAGR
ncbi:HAMP domain-containing sensor histidine kinase [Nocardioides acrostichi]|uniref:histidine kinase n=1 Tax=Nocardioides acrostichi TaxID=2784339 RepID=A0A930UZM7_9ACTN|nr:HAMP domain-containing sensor histidine kinase [Nocardioides acrostichi]MBF4161176.1 HAMP domain-containing histidine kinase [Nocardioides acrostichi]